MATSFLLQTGGPVIGSLFFESFILRQHLRPLYDSSALIPWLPKSFSGVIFFNVITSSVVVLVLGFKVGSARSLMKDKALKDGDVDAESRYSYPKVR